MGSRLLDPQPWFPARAEVVELLAQVVDRWQVEQRHSTSSLLKATEYVPCPHSVQRSGSNCLVNGFQYRSCLRSARFRWTVSSTSRTLACSETTMIGSSDAVIW